MNSLWKPSKLAVLLGQTKDWAITIDEATFSVSFGNRSRALDILDAEHVQIQQGWVWAAVAIALPGGAAARFAGLPKGDGRRLQAALAHAVDARRTVLRSQALVSDFDRELLPALDWSQSFIASCGPHLRTKGWLASEFVEKWRASRPGSLDALMTEPTVVAHVTTLDQDRQAHIARWREGPAAVAKTMNAEHLASELKAHESFLRTVEKSPLTDEQAKAVICFDSRMLVVAAAGSGKTSTMVAKAGFALKRGLVAPERILLLAFNADAAKELQQRVHDRLIPLGLQAQAITARTFHKFGLDVIGAATGKRPTLAPWLDGGEESRMLMTIVDELKDRDPVFRANWDFFRVVLGRDLPSFGEESSEPEDYDRGSQRRGFRTLQGEVVASRGERLIADWLFYNGVPYQYERAYEVDTADASHRQYFPDFYYPTIQIYHEHWALDAQGKAPASFSFYEQGIEWKQTCHAKHGTTLFETTMAQLRTGELFVRLAAMLESHGVKLDPNPDRPGVMRAAIENDSLIGTMRTFMVHAKSNRLSQHELEQRVAASSDGKFTFRHQIFLRLFGAIRVAWETKLRDAQVIDFEDMLNHAADHLEQGRWQSPFELVMVDEFQDASRARARLARALVAQPGRCLFAVGDDWQSINRFAGADLSVMTGFEQWFGTATTMRLEQTFRCPQPLCDVSSRFVLKNPAQIKKSVRSNAPVPQTTISIAQVEQREHLTFGVRRILQEIAEQAAPDEPRGAKVSVFILGRYRSDQHLMPPLFDLSARLQVRFMTIHGSKGLEADHVILPGMVSGARAFPSAVVDDPVLQLSMPEPEAYSTAEERRLFYVALTRARRQVHMLTVANYYSSFVLELIKDHALEIKTLAGEAAATRACPKCHQGNVVERPGRYGRFHACNRFPKCDFTQSIPKSRR